MIKRQIMREDCEKCAESLKDNYKGFADFKQKRFYPIIIDFEKKHGFQEGVVQVHAYHENNRGKIKGYNLFNVKEFNPLKPGCWKLGEKYRVYDSYEDCLKDYERILKRTYLPAWKNRHNAYLFFKGLVSHERLKWCPDSNYFDLLYNLWRQHFGNKSR